MAPAVAISPPPGTTDGHAAAALQYLCAPASRSPIMPPTPTVPAELPPQYRAADAEPAIHARWNAARAWHATPAPEADADARPYSIVIPPPNVTAALHMGHALNNTLQDILVRYHRMLGDNTMWMPGTDHAGIATQTVVDKRLQAEGQPTLKDYKKLEAAGNGGREQFLEKVQAWKDEYEKRILDQLKAMGCSCDWDRTRFTMDEVCAKAVREAFFQLFKDGLIYRGKRLVNWDPVTQTALADDEVEMQEVDGNFYYLRYPICDAEGLQSLGFVTVATTRPETMLGDTAVAVNPKDPRAAGLRGKFVKLPIVNRVIPIIEDDYVVLPDPDSSDAKAKYASGFLKVTPAHDPNDWTLGEKHNLDKINVMAPDASISLDHGWPAEDKPHENADLKPIVGLSREQARKAVVRWFKDHDLLEDVRPYRHSVGHSYRSHVPIEPYLSDQWYIDVKKPTERLGDDATPIEGTDVPKNSLAGAALRALATPEAPHGHVGLAWERQLRFTPERYANTFRAWHENIRDWCISRQLWWGHRIPVWFNSAGVERNPAPEISIHDWSAKIKQWEAEGRVAMQPGRADRDLSKEEIFNSAERGINLCVRNENDHEVVGFLERTGYARDPDVLDTWFSSGLWPLSTMGWPQDTPELQTWNPTDVLCTAREIITLWVSRMVMFNLYFRGTLPFKDVFIHAMIQDGHGQKMSKSLGNGVDPMDIIHSHGSDAMRFTLASMTTHTQDVRMPVDMVDPFTGESFTPQFVNVAGGKVAAPIQERNGRKFGSSFGVASGQVKPSPDMPVARNTSEKFDYGRNFANKLWNAVRFALPHFHTDATPRDGHPSALEDRWVLSRLARTMAACDAALNEYRFADYAQVLYDFVWRDLCDWYIESVKPTLAESGQQQRVIAACFDTSLRLLHPVMPFITERLWEALNDAGTDRSLAGIELPPSDLLMIASWPRVTGNLIDDAAEATFEMLQETISAIRNVRTTYKVPPRQRIDVSAKAPPALAQTLLGYRSMFETLAAMNGREIGPHVERPKDAAACVVRGVELYVHGLIDADTERQRLQKRVGELDRQVATLRSRLGNASYVSRAPVNLVQETRDQLTAAERELTSVRSQLEALD
jgi:valyl-tRNA synthetase